MSWNNITPAWLIEELYLNKEDKMNDTANTEVLVPVTVSPELDEAIKKEIAEGTPVIAVEATEEPV